MNIMSGNRGIGCALLALTGIGSILLATANNMVDAIRNYSLDPIIQALSGNPQAGGGLVDAARMVGEYSGSLGLGVGGLLLTLAVGYGVYKRLY